MDFMIMDLQGGSARPDAILSGYSSLIWTERYNTAGEFELKTPMVQETLDWLPLLSGVTVRGSNQIMLVESHLIEEDEQGYRTLTVSGRALEAFLENRPTYGRAHDTSSTGSSLTIGPMVPRDALLWMLHDNIVASHSGSWAGQGYDEDMLPVRVTNSTRQTGGASDNVVLQGGPKYDNILNFLATTPFGLRTILPTFKSGQVVTSPDGKAISYKSEVINTPCFNLYEGYDRSASQTAREPVVFRYANGDLIKPSYLFSLKDHKSVVYTNTPIGGAAAAISSSLIGDWWERRDLIIYDDSIRSAGGANLGNFLRSKGVQELTNYKQKTWFDAEISPTAPYEYGTHYGLGDKITLEGEYGLSSDMIVTEYIRTEDAEGERGYPTLTVAT